MHNHRPATAERTLTIEHAIRRVARPILNRFPQAKAALARRYEHDGLGRYGDPLDPDGDFKAMQKMRTTVKRGGLMYFAVPLGRDRVLFNVDRIYGRIRFPLLVRGWETVEAFGFHDGLFDEPGGTQPIFVLKNL